MQNICYCGDETILTRCLLCGKGELAGQHNPKTGIAPDGHTFKNDNRPNNENPFGFKDKFVLLSHQKNKDYSNEDLN